MLHGHTCKSHVPPGSVGKGCRGQASLTGADKNMPGWQGPLGHPLFRYPGRNPACQGQHLPSSSHRAALNEATSSPSPGMGLEAPVEQCQTISFSFLPQGPRRWRWAWALHADRRTHQLEDVLILGHDGKFQGVITAEKGEGQAEATRSGERDPPGRGEGSPMFALEGGMAGTHLFWIRPMTWE